MFDDAFLLQVAALQANLRLLETQSDILSDLADMKELRLYKARLADYIEAHVAKGGLPRDPLRDIEPRLLALSKFFAEADRACRELKSWKQDWLKSVPAVGLADLEAAKLEHGELAGGVPRIQEGLKQMLSPLDWKDSTASTDLHPELLACAQCVAGSEFPVSADERQALYGFAHGEGKYAKDIAKAHSTMVTRIENLIDLHAIHAKGVFEAESLAKEWNLRSSQKVIKTLGDNRFPDIDYSKADSQLETILLLFEKFTQLDAALDQRLEKSQHEAIKAELDQLRSMVVQTDSEFSRECIALMQGMESRLAISQKAFKKRRTKIAVIGAAVVLVFAGPSLYYFQSKRNAETASANAKSKLVGLIGVGSEGCTVDVPLPGNVLEVFCWCPAGIFRRDTANKSEALVELSTGFWMAKTEVTQAQWKAVMGNNPSAYVGDEHPVENVNWDDSQRFIDTVNDSGVIPTGWTMSLPTEAQWEHASRAGRTYPAREETFDHVAWHDGISGGTHDVGTKKPNAWGLHDTLGNVWEWCSDWYDDLYPCGENPTGPTKGVTKVLRGGSWRDRVTISSYSDRSARPYDYESDYLGFRPVLVPSK